MAAGTLNEFTVGCPAAAADIFVGTVLGLVETVEAEISRIAGKLEEVFFHPSRGGTVEGAFDVVALEREHLTDPDDQVEQRLSGCPVITDANCVWCNIGMEDWRQHPALGGLPRVPEREVDLYEMVALLINRTVGLFHQAPHRKLNSISIRR